MATFKMLRLGKDAFLALSRNGWNFSIRNLSKGSIVKEFLGLPEIPKKPLNPFLKFFLDARSQYLNENNKWSKDVKKLIADDWKNLDENKKEKYMNKFNEEMKEYRIKVNDYKNTLTDNQRQKLKFVKDEVSKLYTQEVIFHSKRSLKKSFNKPTAPLPVYMSFCKEGGLKNVDGVKNFINQWKDLSSNDKKKFIDEFKKQNEEYKKNLENWELKMMKEGNFNLLRLGTLKELKKYLRFL